MSDNPEQVSPDNQQDEVHLEDIHPEDHFPGHHKENIEVPISTFLTSIVTSIVSKTAWINVLVIVIILIHGEEVTNNHPSDSGSAIGRLFTPINTNKEI